MTWCNTYTILRVDTMNVLLLNIDSKLPNIALSKIEMYHCQQGDNIVWDIPMALTQWNNRIDKVYASCIFTKNNHEVLNYLNLRNDVILGGTGYNHTIKLPPEIDTMKPKINYGFTSRGCIRDCPFCLVRASEGYFKATGDIYDVWDGRSKKIVLFDNNPYAEYDHFEKICRQLIKESSAVDWNQGMDIRLLTLPIIKLLNELKFTSGIRFAFDYPELEPIIREKIALLHQYYKRKYIFFYVLVGFNTTFEQDLHRLNVLRELRCRPYVMRHENTPKEKRYIRLAEWCNQFWTFYKYDFNTFCKEYEVHHH